ncbi:MAG: HRDC domain-containing protein, partial [Rhodospirillaceae bacterium]|nr:HRDC domain-containing protein [Rhodospirillaceae bacterium]
VTHLRDAYRKLEKQLGKNGRAEWLKSEMDILTSPSTYEADPQLAYKRIKTRGAKPRAMVVLQELAAWRETEAQRRDMPRGRILRDDALVEIALHAPTTPDKLGRTRGLSERVANGNQGREIIEAIKRGLAVPDGDLPKPQKRAETPPGIGPVIELMKVLLKLKCEEQGVAQKLVANAADIEKIAAFGKDAEIQALEGWRFDLFGRDALRIRSGELGLAISGNKLVLLENPNGD